MNFLKIKNYILGTIFILVASVSYYFVNQGTISINTYTFILTISIALAIFFFQFGKSMTIESTISDLSKLTHLTKRFQDYDYSTRLQILDEQLMCGSPSLKDIPALSYQAKIENCGLKPIKIDCLCLDYGDKIDSNKRMRRHIDGELYLSPGKWHEFGIEISWVDVEQMKKHFNIDQCFFFFRVAYHAPDGSIQENIRKLGDTRSIIIQKGDCLT